MTRNVWYTPPKWWATMTGHRKMFAVLGVVVLLVIVFILIVWTWLR